MLNFPLELTPFIGRNAERDDLARLLLDPRCRLVTLVGPGGSGKTRLAIEAAKANVTHFADGIYFVGLQAVNSGEFLISSIADAIKYTLHGTDEEAQLLSYLHNKEMLLLLDNFEHLLSAINLLNTLLGHAPGVKLLVTSREILNLREEWLYSVQGMPFPADVAAANLQNFGAVQLFVEHVRHVRRDFSIDAEHIHVVRLCQLVEGMPLALQLAASWLKVLPCSAIVSEIERNLDFLKTTLHDIPIRHRSMRTVFEQSWQLLTEEERQVFSCLSVFRGGFRREAAEQVAGALLGTLSALVDKSLIRYEPNGRYHIHELLRQYAEEQLSRSTEEIQRVHDAHATYYMDFLGQREADLNSARQRKTIQELDEELDNIRAAWREAVQSANIIALHKGGYAYDILSDMQGRYQECIDAFQKAIERLEAIDFSEERDLTLAILHCGSSGLLIRLGRFEEAQAASHKSDTLYRDLDRLPPPGFGTDPLSNMGLLAVTTGDYAGAAALAEQAIKRIVPSDQLNLMFALYVLATTTYSQGQYVAALGHARTAYHLSNGLGDDYFSSYILIIMGNVAQALEDYDSAWEYYQTSYQLKEVFNEQVGMAFALNCMARVAWLRRDYQAAKKLYHQGHDLYHDVNDPGGLATSIFGLGDTAQARGAYTTAHGYFQQALEIATHIHWSPLILAILAGISELLLRTGDREQAVELLALVSQHPANEPPTQSRAQHLLLEAQAVLPPDTYNAARARGETSDLDTVAASIRDQLKLPKAYAPVAATANSLRANQSLVDSLSERELQILSLLAEGLTNQQIAEQLIVVLGTVKTHNHNIFSKLGVTNRVQAIARARELNLL